MSYLKTMIHCQERLKKMNKEWEKVKEFQIKAKQPVSNIPIELNKDRVFVRSIWMLEEIDEFRNSKNIVEQADAIIDLMYFAIGALVEMGIEPDKLFDIVHEANMSKLDSGNNYKCDGNGKILKPKNWISPNSSIKAILEQQKENFGKKQNVN